MKYPNFEEEKKLWQKGFKFVAGLDEAGRGPLAGPVVASAVVLPKNFSAKNFWAVKDSKQLSEKQRDFFYKILTSQKNIKWGVGIVSEKIIDKINILEATKLAMKKAIANLNCVTDFLLLDGNFKIYYACLPAGRRQKSIIKGDQKVFSIAAASIIAKVFRDRLMQKFHKKYPLYGFDNHKGYGTKQHLDAIKKYGPCKIHRKTFYPINSF
jgi:ribonuclease HII